MSMLLDRQVKGLSMFLCLSFLAFVLAQVMLAGRQVSAAEELWVEHDAAVASSLLDQGVPKDVIATSLANAEPGEEGWSLLAAAGLGKQAETYLRPTFSQLQQSAYASALSVALLLLLLLSSGLLIFSRKRMRLHQQVDEILVDYIDGNYSRRLPQGGEGSFFRMLSSVEKLAAMLRSKNEAERATKEFLRDTISDISHQLKTPLAALAMYQEILEDEPDNAETVRRFSRKIGVSVRRMEQLISSMLKITRLDSGTIHFEKAPCLVSELVLNSIGELTIRAQGESKEVQIEGDNEQQLLCDSDWTGEAIENIVKNALDHTRAGGIIRIVWESTPAMLCISISDNGGGIAPEDIHHIFKRFYRSKHSLDTQGIGLGLPLAKSIVEGQGGTISVHSEVGSGTTFMCCFPTES